MSVTLQILSIPLLLSDTSLRLSDAFILKVGPSDQRYGSLLGMQNLSLYLDLLNQNLLYNKIPRFGCPLKFEKHWSPSRSTSCPCDVIYFRQLFCLIINLAWSDTMAFCFILLAPSRGDANKVDIHNVFNYTKMQMSNLA
jgi:hypothetical protein